MTLSGPTLFQPFLQTARAFAASSQCRSARPSDLHSSHLHCISPILHLSSTSSHSFHPHYTALYFPPSFTFLLLRLTPFTHTIPHCISPHPSPFFYYVSLLSPTLYRTIRLIPVTYTHPTPPFHLLTPPSHLHTPHPSHLRTYPPTYAQPVEPEVHRGVNHYGWNHQRHGCHEGCAGSCI